MNTGAEGASESRRPETGPRNASDPVSSLFIAQGAWYSVEQCGLLLSDASHSFARQRFGTAAALTLLAREELGKGALLIALFLKASQGQAITFGEVSAQLRDHRAKQVAALYSIPQFAERGTPLADLMDESRKELAAALPPASESASSKMTATRELAKVVLERVAALPRERRTLRERGLYVDPSEDGAAWERPREFSALAAARELHPALMEYIGLRASYANGEFYAELRDILGAQRPDLPQPPWPPALTEAFKSESR